MQYAKGFQGQVPRGEMHVGDGAPQHPSTCPGQVMYGSWEVRQVSVRELQREWVLAPEPYC